MKQDFSADQVQGKADAGNHGDHGSQEPIQMAAAGVAPAPIVLAQQLGGSNTPAVPPQGPFVPMVPPGAVSAVAGSTTAYAIEADGEVHLPAGTVLDMAQIVGNDLHIMQPDGSLIVIVNGGVATPMIFIGGVALSADVIAALVGLGQGQGEPVSPAAAAAGAAGSAGGEFGQPAGPIDPNSIDLTALLPPTALQFGVPEIKEIGFALDHEPTVGQNPDVIADDDDLSGGNAGGVGDDNATNLSGVLAHDFGDNSISFLATGAPSGFTYELSGNNLLILQNGTLVLTVMLDPATGAYTVIQNSPIDHAPSTDENNQDFTLTYRVTDSDGDFVDGTLNVSIDDDTPTVMANATAVLDDDNLAGGNPGGVGDDDLASVSGTLGHSFGADGGSLAFLTTGAPAGFTYELSGSSLLIKQGATLVLTITLNTATGAYTVTQNAPIDHSAGDNENNQAFTIGYRITDGDGDTVDGSLSLRVDDDTPTVTSNATAVLDDDQFADDNPGGTGDDAIANTSGNIGFSFGADGPGSVAFLTTGAPAGFTYELSGSSLLIKQGATLVLTVTLNTTTGAYTVTQNAVIDHAAGGEENNSIFNLAYRVTDGDGDAVDGTLSISVDDDTPTVSSNAGVVVDEDDLLTGNHDSAPGDDAPANVMGTLGHSFGADGAGTVALLATGAPVGFTYTLSGGGTILTISQDSSGTDVLRITVNSATGAYAVELLNPIDHSVSGTEDNLSFTLNYSVTDGDGDSANGLLSINVDDDLPTAGEQPRPISATVLEDGLAVASGDLSEGNREGGETTTDDEASGAAASLSGLFSVGADQPLTVKLSSNTSGLPTLFSKGDAITYSVSGNVLTATADAGGPDQRVVFTLTVNTDGSWSFDLKDQLDHVDNGLNDENFALRTNAGGTTSVGAIDFSSIILGTDHDGDSVAVAPGTFLVAVQDDVPSGVVSGTVSVHVDEDNLSVAAGDGDLSTGIVDPDTDTDEATFSNAALSAAIAGGADTPIVLTIDSSVSGNVKTTGGDDVKSRGDTVKWVVVDATHVIGFADSNNDGVWNNGEREVFRLTDNGNGTFTFDLKDQLDHAPAAGDNGILTLDLTDAFSVTDFDGDEIALGAGTIRVDVENDIPAGVVSGSVSIHVDEDELSTATGDLSNGITDGDGDTDEATFSTDSFGAAVTPGADEDTKFALNVGVSGNVVTTGGTPVLSQGANVVWGTNAGALVGFVNLGGGAGFDLGTDREVFRLTDNGNGTFTFDLKDQLDHAPAAGDNGILTLDLSAAFGVTDYDGDAVTLSSGSITVVVENDIPQAASGVVASIRVDEDELSTATGDLSNGITDGDGDTDEATFSTASLSALVTPGADEPIDFNLNTALSGNVVTTGGTPVLSQGANVVWGTNAGALVGFVNLGGGAGFDLGTDREVFCLTDNGNGSFTFDLKDQLDHAPAAGDNGILTLDLTSAFTATDNDGDAVTLNADSITVVVENDIPQAASGVVASIRVDEDELSTATGDLSNGITDGDGDTDEATFSTASLSALVTPGADEPIDFNLNTALSGNVVTTGGTPVLSQGANVVWGTNAGALVGFVNLGGGAGFDLGTDREVFCLTDNGNGSFTFDLKDQLDHAPAAGDNGILTLDLTSAFTATDNDGDAVTLNADSITVVVENDIPQAASGVVASIRVDEDELSTATGDLSNGITDGDGDTDEATFSTASLSALVTPGADEPIDFNLNTALSGNVVTTGGTPVLSQGANVVWGTNAGALVGFVNLGGGAGFDLGTDREVFCLTDNGNGSFTFDLKDQLDHAPAAGDNGILTLDLTSAFTATDNDGDAVTLNADSITVVVENDIPQAASGVVASIRVDEDELSTATGDLSNGITDGDGDTDEATFSTASLSALVTPGADEPIDFNLNTALSGNVVTTGGTPVLSQGANVVWGTNAGALVGFVNLGGGAGFDLGTDREVFCLTDNGNGSFTFDLKDQLDHAPAAGDNGILTLDLTSAFTATDNDGDAVTLNADSITVVVENDIPQAASGVVASIRVDEDELSTATGDLSNGITDGDGDTDEATFSTASLSALVTPGADEPIDFNLNTALSGNVVTTGGTPVLSQGANVVWGTNAGALVGFVNLGGGAGFDLGTDREVFCLTDNGNGSFTFDLKDQLDHAPAAGDNGILTLDLTSAFTATDNDGDAVTLNADSITVVVENDIPALASSTLSRTVHEDALDNLQSEGNSEGGAQTTTATGSLSTLVQVGADESGSFSINPTTSGLPALTSRGGTVHYNVTGNTLTGFVDVGAANGTYQAGTDRAVFTLSVDAAGVFLFNLIDQIDHVPNNPANDDSQARVLNLSSAIQFTDGDGDAVTLSSGFSITVEDDVPMAGLVSDGRMANAAGSVTGTVGFSVGADEPATWTLSPLTSVTGVTQTVTAQADGGSLVTGMVGATTFFTLDLNADGSYTFDLVTPRPTTTQSINVASVPSGNYNTITPVGSDVTFDGLTFGATNSAVLGSTNPDDGSTDRLHVQANGFGSGGNANMDDQEGFVAFFASGATGLNFNLNPVGTANLTITYWVYSSNPFTGSTYTGTPLGAGAYTLPVGSISSLTPAILDPSGVGEFSYMIVRFDYGASNDKVVIDNFSYSHSVVPQDVSFQFGVTLMDTDGDIIAGNGSDAQTIDVQLKGGTGAATTLVGDSSDEALVGGPQADTLSGGDGNDILQGNSGNDIIDGGGGIDLVSFADGSGGGLTFTLVQGSSDTAFDASGANLGTDTYKNIEGVIGTNFADVLTGSSSGDILQGGGGADTLAGGLGIDKFVLTDAATADTILDYASGETIDLSALLDKALIQGGTQGSLTDFVKLTNSGPDRVLQIDANGTAGGTTFTTVAIFSPAQPATVHILYDNTEANVPQT